jgi:hypothetical protein
VIMMMRIVIMMMRTVIMEGDVDIMMLYNNDSK